MATIGLYGPPPIPSEIFAYDSEKPTYQTEFLSWTLSKNLERMQAAGLVFDDGQLLPADLDRLWARQTDTIELLRQRLSNISNVILESAGVVGGTTIVSEFCACFYGENTSLLEMDKTTLNYWIRKRSIDMQTVLVQKIEENTESKEFWRWISEQVPEFLDNIRDAYWGNGGRGAKQGGKRGLPVLFTGLTRFTGLAISPYVGVGIILFQLLADVIPIVVDVLDNISDYNQAAEAITAFKKAFLNQDEEGFLEDELGRIGNTEGVTDVGYAKFYNKSRIVEY